MSSKSLVFHILCGKPINNFDLYKNCRIEFGIISENEHKAENLKQFKLSFLIPLNIRIRFDCKQEEKLSFKLVIILKRQSREIEKHISNSYIIDPNTFKQSKMFLSSINIGEATFKFVFAVTHLTFSSNFSIIDLDDERKIRRFESSNDEKLIGEGGCSRVYRFHDHYALKAIKLTNVLSFQESWVRELVLFLMTDHPSIIKMFGYQISGPGMFGYVLEYAEHGSLSQYIGKISFKQFMTSLSSAMIYLHSRGVVHRDLKPSNILVFKDGEIKLSDFGTCRPCECEMTKGVGTLSFMAPEVDKGHYDYQADVYSAGVVACFLIDRDHFYQIAKSIKEEKHVKGVPFETQVTLRAMLSDDPSSRPSFIETLLLLLNGDFFVITDEQENGFSKFLINNYERGSDYVHYKRSRNNIGLFHCLMHHYFYSNMDKVGELSHLGQLLGDKLMSYMFDHIVLFGDTIAHNLSLNKMDMQKRYMDLNVSDYRFFLLPYPDKKSYKCYNDSEYEKGIEMKEANQEIALQHFIDSYESDNNTRARYQIGRIYSDRKDTKCFQYLNELALEGHKKSCNSLASFFNTSKKYRNQLISKYFLLVSENCFSKYKNISRYKKNDPYISYYDNNNQGSFSITVSDPAFVNEYGTDLFKLCRIHFTKTRHYIGFYYLNMLKDEVLTNFYFKKDDRNGFLIKRMEITEGKEREEIFNKIKQRASEGDLFAQYYIILEGEIFTGSYRSKYLSNLITSNQYSTDSYVQFYKGIDSFINCDYSNGMLYIDLAARQKNSLAVFVQSLLTFHGHCYKKERVNSLKELINVSKVLGNVFAFDVGVILLQGVYIDQDIDKGIELIKIARSTGFKIPKSIIEGKYHTKLEYFYSRLIEKEYETYFKNKEIDVNEEIRKKSPICGNPKFQTYVGILAYSDNELSYEIAKSWFNYAIEQDYVSAEYEFALVSQPSDALIHLIRGAKGGDDDIQVILGLNYFYGTNAEVNVEKGLYWLEISAYQDSPVALEILAAIYCFGFGDVPIDNKKAHDYYIRFMELTGDGKLRNYYDRLRPLINAIIDCSEENLYYFESNKFPTAHKTGTGRFFEKKGKTFRYLSQKLTGFNF